MSQFALPILFALFVWWFGTGIVLCLVRLGARKLDIAIGIATLGQIGAAWGLAASARLPTVGGAYVAFTCAILAWCWVEITFLSGRITGPRKEPSPAGASGWRRVRFAIGAILYHELALLAFAVGVVILTWQGDNQVGAATFLVLWVMRLSAKLNLFLGVPILNDELLPARLGYLRSYFWRRPVSPFFPVAVTLSTAAVVLLVTRALAAGTAFEIAALLLLSTLMALAVLEHWFMVVPLPVKAIWEWSMGGAPVMPPDALVADLRRLPEECSAKGQPGDRAPLTAVCGSLADSDPAAGAQRPALATLWRHR